MKARRALTGYEMAAMDAAGELERSIRYRLAALHDNAKTWNDASAMEAYTNALRVVELACQDLKANREW